MKRVKEMMETYPVDAIDKIIDSIDTILEKIYGDYLLISQKSIIKC